MNASKIKTGMVRRTVRPATTNKTTRISGIPTRCQTHCESLSHRIILPQLYSKPKQTRYKSGLQDKRTDSIIIVNICESPTIPTEIRIYKQSLDQIPEAILYPAKRGCRIVRGFVIEFSTHFNHLGFHQKTLESTSGRFRENSGLGRGEF